MAEPTVQVPVSQCPAVNDSMEGVRCHGDAGHNELHWADVSGDGEVTEWGDTDELWDEIDRLRVLLSQMTPSAERCICNTGPDTDGPDIECPLHGMPPNIEEMAPGTLLELGKKWTVARDNDGVAFLYATDDGYSSLMPASAVDPSTIRDVTPPPATPEAD